MLTRDALKEGWLQRMAATPGGETVHFLTEAELEASRRTLLRAHPPADDLWLFGYGSLIWNPAFHFVERRHGRIHGFHRRFCLWTRMGRGCPVRPGLMLGLDHGGSCTGVFYRIAATAIEEELPLVWRREMLTSSYRPVWIRGRLEDRADGNEPIRALGFVINRAHERYAGALDDEAVASSIAHAEGPLGRCSEYLFATTEHLNALGIRDRGLEALCRRVRLLQTEEGYPQPKVAE